MKPVRTRYAPSPTGDPHIGNIRSALFSWAYARANGGQFLLRIEDTDRNRLVETSRAGDHGQSALARHRLGRRPRRWRAPRAVLPVAAAAALPEDRADAHRAGQGVSLLLHRRTARPDARGPGRSKSPARLRRPLPGHPAGRIRTARKERALRRPVQDEATRAQTVLHDIIRGDIVFENALQDDFVVLKSDGYPTYHLGVVVDDTEMEITHAIRGDEWISSAPKHIQLYEALGWEARRSGPTCH